MRYLMLGILISLLTIALVSCGDEVRFAEQAPFQEPEAEEQSLGYSCGNKKVFVCHRNRKTLCVYYMDSYSHIHHGDEMGRCSE